MIRRAATGSSGRRSLKPDHWPGADRATWDRVVASGDLLEGGGSGAHWRAVTRGSLQGGYGLWLAFLVTIGVDLAASSPGERVTRERVKAYLDWLGNLAPSSRWARLRELSATVTHMDPGRDWRWLRRLVQRLQHTSKAHGPTRPKTTLSSARLYGAGLTHIKMALTNSGSPRRVALDVRDGLMIALLAARPLRIRNFAMIRIGSHLLETAGGFRIHVPGQETKTGQPIETTVPEELVPYLRDYIERWRPILLGQHRHDRLWVGCNGEEPEIAALGRRLSRVTERLLGRPVNPHFFRHCAATTLATEDPERVRLVTALLGHRTAATGERYYNHAKTLDASRRHRRSIEKLRQQLRRQRTS